MTPVPILLYHSISESASRLIRPFSVAPAVFRSHLDSIVASGSSVLTISGFVSAIDTDEVPDRPVLITFDDGFADFYGEALPALSDRRLASTLYVTTGFLEGRPDRAVPRPPDRMLDWSQLGEIAGEGVEIGGHSHTHLHLDTLPRRKARDEIARCKYLLEEELGRPVLSFAYPNGYSSATVRRFVREAGYRSACSVKNAISSSQGDRLSLARLTVRNTTTIEDVVSWIACVGAPPESSKEALRTKSWRAYRRMRALIKRRPGSDFW
jgi:peptidoglycan/xylan/chitin deacetylase (PgdA/CDA1 family)